MDVSKHFASGQQHPLPPLLGNGVIDDDDWEYEYDENETEDIYFTLDLTSHVPNALVQKSSYNVPDADGEEQSQDGSTIQIVDLHTDHPLVKLDEGVYDCAWTTDLGTQFHISEAGIVDTPYRPGTVLDIIGTSQTRLLGRPVELHSRSRSENPVMPDKNDTDAIIVNQESESELEQDDLPEPSSPGLRTAPGQQLHIPRELCKDPAGEAQASFLERLSEIKLKKGEKDAVPIYSIRVYDPPANASELRQQGLDADAENARLMKDVQRAATSQRPQKRRRKMTYAEKGVISSESGLAASGRHSRETISTRLGLQSQQSAETIQTANELDHTVASEGILETNLPGDNLGRNIILSTHSPS